MGKGPLFCCLQSALFELFNKLVYALQLARNVNLLRTMAHALAALDAMVCLTELGNTTIVADEEGTTSLLVVLCLLTFRYISGVDTFVIVNKDGRNVKAIGARHTIFAVVAIDGGIALDECRCFTFEPLLFFFGEGLERRVCTHIVFQVLHVCHATEDGKNFRLGTNVTECPRGNAVFGFALFEEGNDVVGNFGEASAEQRLHDDNRDVALGKFFV